MMRSRVEQRDELMTQLGKLVIPIERALESGTFQPNAVPYLQSQYERDRREFLVKVDGFCRHAEHFFANELNNVHHTINHLEGFIDRLRRRVEQPEHVRDKFSQACENIRAAIRAIPCDDPDINFPAGSPFQAYMRLRAHCTGVTNRLEIFDPYLDPSVFHRYAAEVPPAAMLTIVTAYGNQNSPMSKPAKRAAIVAVSELVARERRDKYRFYVAPSFHDRHLRADDTVLHLGGSMAHAALKDAYTITKATPPDAVHAELDAIIKGAEEWYGPSVTTHRTS